MPIQWRKLYTSKSSKFLSILTKNWQFLQKNIFFFIFDFLAKIFGPSRQLSMPGRFDFMKFFVRQLWKKNVSWFQLFVYIFQKNLKFFSKFVSNRKISLWIANYDEFLNLWNFHQKFWGRGSQKFWWKFHEFESSPL